MGEVVDELARFGRLIVSRVEAPGALLFFSHELTGPFDLGIKRREWWRVHGIAARVHSRVRDWRASLPLGLSTELGYHVRSPLYVGLEIAGQPAPK